MIKMELTMKMLFSSFSLVSLNALFMLPGFVLFNGDFPRNEPRGLWTDI